jgi:hypothetical protein
MLFQTGELGAVLGPILVGVTAQVLDNVAFTPIAVSRSVDLHPLLVLTVTLAGGELLGRKAEMHTAKGLNPHFGAEVLRVAEVQYEQA